VVFVLLGISGSVVHGHPTCGLWRGEWMAKKRRTTLRWFVAYFVCRYTRVEAIAKEAQWVDSGRVDRWVVRVPIEVH
jgi:hypothetical protein